MQNDCRTRFSASATGPAFLQRDSLVKMVMCTTMLHNATVLIVIDARRLAMLSRIAMRALGRMLASSLDAAQISIARQAARVALKLPLAVTFGLFSNTNTLSKRAFASTRNGKRSPLSAGLEGGKLEGPLSGSIGTGEMKRERAMDHSYSLTHCGQQR